ncbi:MAG TPA: hypothetical protein VMA32_13780 [Streptosporangiaceae bacterium]|nr:hypothetical protein [Streptosporangiaceae bacterium]
MSSLTGHFAKSAGRAATVAALIAATAAIGMTAATGVTVATGATAAAGVTSARVAPASTPAATTSTTVPGAPNCPMFPANNIWNTNISKLPVNSHSAAWLRSMDSGSTYLHPDFGPNTGGYPYGIPFTIVTNKHKTVRIKFQYASESYRGRYPFGAGTPIEGGKNAGGDRHAIMVNSTTCTLYELWEARYSPRGSTAGSGAMWHLTSNALRPAGWTSADAAGLPILPGLLNYRQVKEAVATGQPITHAIRFTAASTSAAYLWPARHEAGSGRMSEFPPMGARFRLKASFNVAGFCRNSQPYCQDAKAVLVEMQNYGLILADNGSNWYFQGSAFPQWPDALVSLLKGIPARAFQAVNESCLEVHKNSARARAKPGCPIG